MATVPTPLHFPRHALRLRRLGIDTYREPVIFMRADCHVCRSIGIDVQSRVQVTLGERTIIATMNAVTGDLLDQGEASLSESAWAALGASPGAEVTLSHPLPVESLSHLRAKMYGARLDDHAMREIIADIVAGYYSNLQLSAFVTACAGDRLDSAETTALTREIIGAGQSIRWPQPQIVDKHSVGGQPGNRTTLIVVPIVAAFGLTIPKTSSRAITSPAGTADTMETLAPVALDAAAMRSVVERENGCIVWGGSVGLSPADDLLIRVERPLDIDSEGQLVASILSKKAAAGATHVVIDMPVGATAKVRSEAAAVRLAEELVNVGRAVGLEVMIVQTDGSQPVGRGIGPALEARDALAVLQRAPDAPRDLRERAILLASPILELSPQIPAGSGAAIAAAILDDGRAWSKFQAIAEAQGGLRVPPRAPHTHALTARAAGRVERVDNRRLARVAKLAGAPRAPAAGIEFLAPLGTRVERGQPLFVVHAQARGELAYALEYLKAQEDLVEIAPAR